MKKRRKRGRRERRIRRGRSTSSHKVDHFYETQITSIRRKRSENKFL